MTFPTTRRVNNTRQISRSNFKFRSSIMHLFVKRRLSTCTLFRCLDPSHWPVIDPLPSYRSDRVLPSRRHQSIIYGYNLTDVMITDGAHTAESTEVCANWFSNAVKSGDLPVKHENFSCEEVNKIRKKVRDPRVLLPPLVLQMAFISRKLYLFQICPRIMLLAPRHQQFPLIYARIHHSRKQFKLLGKIPYMKKKVITSNCREVQNFDNIFSNTLLGEDLKKCNHLENCATSLVIPSLPLAIKLLRKCTEDNPSLILQDDELTGDTSSVDVSSRKNLLDLVDIGKGLLNRPVSRVNLETEVYEPVDEGTNGEALIKFAGWLSEERMLRCSNVNKVDG